jgi:hypothetical protein
VRKSVFEERMSSERPSNVGILAMEMYFPKFFVDQTDMELADGCVGKCVYLSLRAFALCLHVCGMMDAHMHT